MDGTLGQQILIYIRRGLMSLWISRRLFQELWITSQMLSIGRQVHRPVVLMDRNVLMESLRLSTIPWKTLRVVPHGPQSSPRLG